MGSQFMLPTQGTVPGQACMGSVDTATAHTYKIFLVPKLHFSSLFSFIIQSQALHHTIASTVPYKKPFSLPNSTTQTNHSRCSDSVCLLLDLILTAMSTLHCILLITFPRAGEAHEQYQQAYDTGNGQPNEAKFSHEAIAGAASFAAFKAFEDHQRSEGKTSI